MMDPILHRKALVRKMIPMTNGIFHYIGYSFPSYLSITAQELDIIFISNWGLRTVAPVVLNFHDEVSQLTPSELQQLANVVKSLYSPKWDKLKNIMNMEYDPIHNYSDTYHEELTENIDRTDEVTHNTTESTNEQQEIDIILSDGGSQVTTEERNTSETRTDNLSQAVNASGTQGNTRTNNLSEGVVTDTQNDIYGFNSEEAVGDNTSASESTRTNTGTITDAGTNSTTSTTTNTGTQGKSQQGSVETTVEGGLTHTTDENHAVTGSKRNTGTETDVIGSERTRLRDFTHLGNIGNLSTQQLLKEEIELWRWNFINEVLNDVKDFLTLPLYD